MPINSSLARLIDLVPFISQHQGISIAELAAKFGVSVGEIEKDLWLLYCCGLPGQTPLELMEFSFEDGYVTVRNADELRSPRSLTQIELATLLVGLDLLATLGSDLAKELRAKLSKKFASQIAYKPDLSERYLPEILKAIQGNQVLKIKYKGEVREVIPFEIYQENGARYLRSYCKKALDRRTFKLSRIEDIEILDTRELPPNSVASQNFIYETKIRILRNARLVREMLGLDREDSSIVRYFSKDWLFEQTLALAGAVELLDTELRSELRERIWTSQNLYLG